MLNKGGKLVEKKRKKLQQVVNLGVCLCIGVQLLQKGKNTRNGWEISEATRQAITHEAEMIGRQSVEGMTINLVGSEVYYEVM